MEKNNNQNSYTICNVRHLLVPECCYSVALVIVLQQSICTVTPPPGCGICTWGWCRPAGRSPPRGPAERRWRCSGKSGKRRCSAWRGPAAPQGSSQSGCTCSSFQTHRRLAEEQREEEVKSSETFLSAERSCDKLHHSAITKVLYLSTNQGSLHLMTVVPPPPPRPVKTMYFQVILIFGYHSSFTF